MAAFNISFGVFAFVALLFAVISPMATAQAPAPSVLASAPSATSDGTSIDQGIAYILMLVALAITYLIH